MTSICLGLNVLKTRQSHDSLIIRMETNIDEKRFYIESLSSFPFILSLLFQIN